MHHQQTFFAYKSMIWTSQVAQLVKNLPVKAGASRDAGPVPGGGHDNPLQHSCWKNPADSRLQATGSHRVRLDWAPENSLFRIGQALFPGFAAACPRAWPDSRAGAEVRPLKEGPAKTSPPPLGHRDDWDRGPPSFLSRPRFFKQFPLEMPLRVPISYFLPQFRFSLSFLKDAQNA